MKTIKMDSDWDFDITNGKLQMIEDPDKYNQDVSLILKTTSGDDIFNTEFGVDWIPIINYPSKSNLRNGIVDGLGQYGKAVLIEDLVIEEDEENRRYDVTLKIKIDSYTTSLDFSIGE